MDTQTAANKKLYYTILNRLLCLEPMSHYDLSSLLQWLHERDILSPCFCAGARPPLRYQSFVAV